MRVSGYVYLSQSDEQIVQVDALDARVQVGSRVRMRSLPHITWRVARLATWLMGREHDTDKPGEMVLRGQLFLPLIGSELEVVE